MQWKRYQKSNAAFEKQERESLINRNTEIAVVKANFCFQATRATEWLHIPQLFSAAFSHKNDEFSRKIWVSWFSLDYLGANLCR